MAPFLGNFSLWLALCFAVLQFAISYQKNNKSTLYLNRIAVKGLFSDIGGISFISDIDWGEDEPSEDGGFSNILNASMFCLSLMKIGHPTPLQYNLIFFQSLQSTPRQRQELRRN